MLDTASLRERLSYDPAIGDFKWKIKTGQRGRVGAVAGCNTPLGYRIIRLGNKGYGAHRLAWLYMTGEMPDSKVEIDHIDGNPSNNAFANLRLATKSQNAQNVRRARANSKTGLLGACPHHGRFVAQITIDGAKRRIGSFATAIEAHEAYVLAKRELHERSSL